MRNDDVVMTPIIDILNNVTHSVDFGSVFNYAGETEDDQRTNFWLDVMRSKSGDSGMGHLVDSILDHGFTDSAIGWYGHNITEGHHRLVAAILLGMDEIPTSPYGRDSDHRVCAHCAECEYSDGDGTIYPIELD